MDFSKKHPSRIIVDPAKPSLPTSTPQPRVENRKAHVEDDWNADSIDALRGYAALSRDETAGTKLDRRHLKMSDDQKVQQEPNRNLPNYEWQPHRDRAQTRYNAQDGHARQYLEEPREPIIIREYERGSNPFIEREVRRTRPLSPGASERSEPIYEHFTYVEQPPPPPDSDDRSSVASGSESIDIRTSRRHQPSRSGKERRRGPPKSAPVITPLSLVHTKREPTSMKEMLEELDALREENERLRQGQDDPQIPTQPAILAYTSRVFHQVGGTLYLDQPHWEPAEGGNVVLQANNPIRNIDYYLDQHPEIAFAIYKEYNQLPPADRSKIETKDGVYRTPSPAHEFLSLIADAMLDAIEDLIERVPEFGEYFPYFDPDGQIPAPYLFMYYSTPFIADILPELDLTSQNLIRQLQTAIDKSHGYEYESAKLQAEKGLVARHLLKYLFRPGDVLISNTPDYPQAYISMGWIETPEVLEEMQYEEWDQVRRKRIPRYGSLAKAASSKKVTTYSWVLPVWYWRFDGVFSKQQVGLKIYMDVGYEEEAVQIRSLNIYPLKYAPKETRALLEKRGKTFWSIRHRRFVSYLRSEDEELYNIEDRYMVDIKTYKRLFPASAVARLDLRDDIGVVEMLSDDPPKGDALLVFPPSIMAYNLLRKSWRELFVDRITDIVWNKQAFKDLVAESETKELVQALVMKQLVAKESTDFVTGKGNGLIMLLHGAPGTGKTFTAEGVAEFAEKPLLRVTCGDVGTHAEIVDQRLQATFELGKLWDCVVLLDEADVFLEERDMKDLNRNALVSVFLRALEYYDGILILTSNRVGTFDEAFKSRIQLALHYENLGISQRRKIWRNFMNRIKTLGEDESKADVDDIMDHIDDLSKEVMNGREIRNAITIARQLAQFKGEPFRYSHLKHVIGVGSKFGRYLKDLRMGLTDDDIKADGGLRLSYTTDTNRN